MRRLHATGPRERFLASGVYEQPDGLLEHWSIHEVGQDAWFVRVDRDGRAGGQCSLLQEALRNGEGFFERVEQQLYGPDGRPLSRLRCTRFSQAMEMVESGRFGQLETRVDLETDALIVPPGSLLSGMALARAARIPQPLSRLKLTRRKERWAWRLLGAEACCSQDAAVCIDGRQIQASRCSWQCSAERVWLDRHDVALLLEDGTRSIRLRRYARRHV